jgi:hypothetical protein
MNQRKKMGKTLRKNERREERSSGVPPLSTVFSLYDLYVTERLHCYTLGTGCYENRKPTQERKKEGKEGKKGAVGVDEGKGHV